MQSFDFEWSRHQTRILLASLGTMVAIAIMVTVGSMVTDNVFIQMASN